MKDYFKNLGVLEAIKKASEGIYPETMHEKSLDDLEVYWQHSDWNLRINYKISQQYVTIARRLACSISQDKEKDLCEILNSLNSLFLSVYVYMHPKESAVELKAGMYVIDHNFDEKAFNSLVFQINFISKGLFPILRDFVSGKLTKEKMLTMVERRDFINLNMICDDVVLKKEQTDLPYRINVGDLDYPLPGHTHGLNELGLPEFILNVKTFWEAGEWDGRNHCLIDGAYAFLIDPKYHEKLESILSGQTVKVSQKELMPNSKSNGSQVYCFRELPSTHWAIKRAYRDEGIKPGMRFIHIYAGGDDTFLKPVKTTKRKELLPFLAEMHGF